MIRRNEPVKLVDYGGNMAFLWEKYMTLDNQKKKLIWCAEIAIEKEQQGEIWGGDA